MTTLIEKITERLTDLTELDAIDVSVPLKSGSSLTRNIRLNRNERLSVRERYVENQCRKIIENISGETNFSYNYNLSISEIASIDESLANLSNRFNSIEDLYNYVLANDKDRVDLSLIKSEILRNRRYHAEILGMKRPYKNRAIFIWQILWGILSTYYNEMLPLLNDIDSEENSTLKNRVADEIERRLRVIERMRYNVSRDPVRPLIPNRSLAGPSGSRTDGHTLRIFEYPANSMGFYEQVGGKGSDYWEEKSYGASGEFFLKDSGRGNPADAINSLFHPPDNTLPFRKWWEHIERRNVNYCDRVIHTLHLESLANYLDRNTSEPNTYLATELDRCSDFEQMIGIFTGPKYPGAIASGRTHETCGKDIFFERKRVKLIDVVAGDHIILNNHPAYQGLSKGAFRLENAIVTKVTGPTLPLSFEVQGHGLGPFPFVLLQKELIKDFISNLTSAQDRIRNKTISGRSILSSALENASNNQPFFYDQQIDTTTDDYDPASNGSFTGTVEFRNELAPIGIGAFWAKWFYRFGPRQRISADLDGVVEGSPESQYMPFVHSLSLNTSEKLITLQGINLDRDKIESIYFINHPNRFKNSDGAWDATQGDHPLYIHSGLDISSDDIIYPSESDSNYGNQIQILIPNSWDPQRKTQWDPPTAENGNSHFWRPVLRLNIKIDIRADSVWFRWPQTYTQSDLSPSTSTNTAYFPLFERNISTGDYSSAVQVDNLLTIAYSLQSFYRQSVPDDTILVISPLNASFGGEI